VFLHVAPEAELYIASHGGRLYLWQESVGGAWAKDRVGFEDPGLSVGFVTATSGLTEVLLAADLEPPERLLVTTHRSPRRGLRVEWDGQVWGWRGPGTS
jgi:hypothetical protein